jgi:4-hydroxy-tetrahydrodipicolinate reductase
VAIRVVQWTTGNVGKQSVKAMATHPELELVGCYAWSDAKVGVDVGTLAGIDPIGVTATNDVDALLALRPDAVVYNPMWPSIDELVRILEAGANVVTTAAFITGGRLGDDRHRLVEACQRGGSSLFGTGVSPGFAELVAITIAGICSRVDKVTVTETADTTFYDSPDTERVAGFGQPIDHPGLHDMARDGTAVFGEAVAMVADALGVQLDEIVCEAEFARTTADLAMASWTIPAGHVAGVAASWQGRVGGRTVVDLNVRWKKGSTLDPNWVIERDGWVIRVDGLPTVTSSLDFLPPADFQAETIEEFMAIGHIITAVPALNAIPAVVAAPPGIVTYADLPFPMPRGWVRDAGAADR